jgi:hypothetical protein
MICTISIQTYPEVSFTHDHWRSLRALHPAESSTYLRGLKKKNCFLKEDQYI